MTDAGGRREWWDKFIGGEKEDKAENPAQAEGRGGQHSTAIGSSGARNMSCHRQSVTFQAGNSDAVGLFIDQTDSVRYINELNNEHEGPLHFASRSQSLLKLNLSLNDDRSGDKRTVELLVNNGAKVTILR